MRKRFACLLVLAMLLACAASFAEGGVAVGDKVTFGKYWQHMAPGNTPAAPEPIVWRVLAVDGDKALLLAEQPLVGMPYNDDDHFLYEVTWETCSLRAWLNGDFLNDAFSSGEKQAIQPTAVSTADYVGYDGYTVSGGNDTTDKVFLLSTKEATKYLKTEASRKCCPTDYAVSTGASKSWFTYYDDSGTTTQSTDNVCNWWLRDPGRIGHYVAECTYTGSVGGEEYAGTTYISVRPAAWVSISALGH